MTEPKVSCPIALDESKLDAWLSGEGPEAERRELTAHLMSCADCRAEKVRLGRERALFAERAAQPDPGAAALWSKIAPQLAVAPPQRRSRGASLAGGLVAVAAALMLFVRFGVQHGLSTPAAIAPPPNAVGSTQTQGAALPLPKAAGPSREILNTTVEPGDKGRRFLVSDLPDKVRWEFDATEAPKIEVSNVAGEIAIHASTRSDVTISAHNDQSEVSAGWQLEVRAISPDHFVVRVFCDRDCDDGANVDLGLDVPIGSRITASTVSGELSVHGGTGTVEVSSVSGDVTVGGARAIKIHSTSGDVSIETPSRVSAKVETVSGDIAWTGGCGKGCAAELHSTSGDTSIELDDHASFSLAFHTVSGNGPTGGVHYQGDAGKVRVDTVSGDLQINGYTLQRDAETIEMSHRVEKLP